MAGFDFSGIGRSTRTIDECYLTMLHASIINYFNTYRSRLTPTPDGLVADTPVTIYVKKSNGTIRKIGEIISTDELHFGFPITISDETQDINVT